MQHIATEKINAVYAEHGKDPEEPRGSKNDPKSKASLEQGAFRKAFGKLEYRDRCVIADALRVLSAKAGLQKDAALAVLMKIGLFLEEVEK